MKILRHLDTHKNDDNHYTKVNHLNILQFKECLSAQYSLNYTRMHTRTRTHLHTHGVARSD